MIGLIVEGQCERDALPPQMRSKCVVRRRQLNGKRVSLLQIANECTSLLRALDGRRCRKFLIVVDREERTLTAQEMANQLTTLIAERVSVPFRLVVADRMFENWLLADVEAIVARYSNDFNPASNSPAHEGINGKARLRQLMRKPCCYGPEVAKKYYSAIRIPVAEQNSISFKSWTDVLRALSIL